MADKTTEWRLELPGTPAMDPSGRVLAINIGEPANPWRSSCTSATCWAFRNRSPSRGTRIGKLLAGVTLHVQKAQSETPPGDYSESRLNDGWKDVPLTFAGHASGADRQPENAITRHRRRIARANHRSGGLGHHFPRRLSRLAR